MSEKIVQLNEGVIKGQLKELVRGSVEETLNELLEAEVVRKIFELYIQGNGVRKIKKYLESHSIKTITGKSEWSTSTMDQMLSDEKYVG